MPLIVAVSGNEYFPFIKYDMFSLNFKDDKIIRVQLYLAFKDGTTKRLNIRKIFYPFDDRSIDKFLLSNLNNSKLIRSRLKYAVDKYKLDQDYSNVHSIQVKQYYINRKLFKQSLLSSNEITDPAKSIEEKTVLYEELF